MMVRNQFKENYPKGVYVAEGGGFPKLFDYLNQYTGSS